MSFFRAATRLCAHLPIACRIHCRILAVHSGISHLLTDYESFAEVKRPFDLEEMPTLARQLIFNEPTTRIKMYREDADTEIGHFGFQAVDKLCKDVKVGWESPPLKLLFSAKLHHSIPAPRGQRHNVERERPPDQSVECAGEGAGREGRGDDEGGQVRSDPGAGGGREHGDRRPEGLPHNCTVTKQVIHRINISFLREKGEQQVHTRRAGMCSMRVRVPLLHSSRLMCRRISPRYFSIVSVVLLIDLGHHFLVSPCVLLP